jgi:deazaflavin-dependent oxidoreductase (nitroreductase family)
MTMSDQQTGDRTPLRYQRGNWLGKYVLNGLVALLARLGISLWDSRVLRVRGRKSGRLYTTPVNLLTIDGQRYLVAPRGHTQWVRNLRAAGDGELQLGRTVERFSAVEVPIEQRPSILRTYLRRWGFEAGMFFAGVNGDSPETDLARIAPDHPVFAIDRAS